MRRWLFVPVNNPYVVVSALMLAQATTLHAQSAASAPPSQPDNASRADVQAPATSRSLPANARRARAQAQAQAQVPPAKPAATPDRPAADTEGAEQTTATYGDWQIRCQLTAAVAGQSARRSCELVQSVVLQGQTAPFAQLGFGRLAAAGPIFFTAVVPTNVTFPSSVKVALDGNDKQPPLEIPWTRCLPGGCFASIEIKDDVMKRWRTQSQNGRVTFKNGAGQDLAVPISFKGLAQALDAFAKEN